MIPWSTFSFFVPLQLSAGIVLASPGIPTSASKVDLFRHAMIVGFLSF
jgi:hypothetical protein